MDTRALLVREAARLLAESPTGEISTRAVCDAAGVTQPVLYRLFGDKDGLLAAVVDTVWEEYLTSKRSAEPSADPLADLRVGWDNHTAFALAHPHAYRLVFGSTLTTRPAALEEAMSLLTEILERLASQGRLRLDPRDAAQIVMAANSGLALSLILRPDAYPDPAISATTREATFEMILAETETPPDDAAVVAAHTLRTYVAGSDRFTPAEAGLLTEWLGRIR